MNTSISISKKEFVLAGDAIFTIDNGKGEHYTFRIQKVEASERWAESFFVKLLTGPNNTSDYTYMGKLDAGTGTVHLTAKSKYAEDSLPVKVVRWALRIVWSGRDLPTGYALHHEGRCGRCGRTLTTPESCERGIGPECWSIMQGE